MDAQMALLPYFLGALALAYQLLVSVNLLRFKGYSGGQKAAQLALIWLLPIVGALVVHTVLNSTTITRPKADEDFVPQRPNDHA